VVATATSTPIVPQFRQRWLLRPGPHLPPPSLLAGLNPMLLCCVHAMFDLFWSPEVCPTSNSETSWDPNDMFYFI
jgi:hypothetical protein